MANLHKRRRLSGNPVSSAAIFLFLLSLSFILLNGYLCCLFAAPHGLTDNTANRLCNIYVLISDTRFRCIKGLTRIHYHSVHQRLICGRGG
jgi:hypothetical protein